LFSQFSKYEIKLENITNTLPHLTHLPMLINHFKVMFK
jgi:hypothetical protein